MLNSPNRVSIDLGFCLTLYKVNALPSIADSISNKTKVQPLHSNKYRQLSRFFQAFLKKKLRYF